eukprot:scaffold55666_cov43-Cyclotella_meneghiniana.AAC.1
MQEQRSIRESDRYTTDDRVAMGMMGVCATIFGVVLNYVAYLTGAKYHGKIHVIRTLPRGCPECSEGGPVEIYKEQTDTRTEREYRVIYTRVKTTETWITKIHCMACGNIEDYDPDETSYSCTTAQGAQALEAADDGSGLKQGSSAIGSPILSDIEFGRMRMKETEMESNIV